MKCVSVNLKDSSYKIIIGNRMLSQLGPTVRSLAIGKDAVVITNRMINRLHGKAVVLSLKKSGYSVNVLEVPDGEKSKSMQYVFHLIGKIARYDVRKDLFLVVLGGGVIGDLAGYVAACYRRGIPYVQVPTTFLAQVDSAIGGKVAIDLPVGKNLVGAFYQPALVFSDVAVLSTLTQRQIRNGLAEVMKYGIISSRPLFDYVAQNHRKLLARDLNALTEVVTQCSQIKARVVINDEKETRGVRTMLNFGHTFGHAIETAGRFSHYHHGEAVALGMQMAADLSSRLGLLDKRSVLEIEKVLTDIGLPSKVKKLRLSSILKAMEHDKKFKGKKKRFVLATKIGSVKVSEDIPPALIKKVIRARM